MDILKSVLDWNLNKIIFPSFQGHTIGHAMTGMFSGGDKDKEVQQQQAAPVQQQYAPPPQQNQNQSPCGYQLEQFLSCAQNQHDLTLCDGFNEALRQCKVQYNV